VDADITECARHVDILGSLVVPAVIEPLLQLVDCHR
jgi:hypothetical protein